MHNGADVSFRRCHVVFDGSFDGFLCIIYAYYYRKIIPQEISKVDYIQTDLFNEICNIETDNDKAAKVAEGIKNKISVRAFERSYLAFSCKDLRFMDLFRYIIFGFQTNEEVDRHMHIDFVRNIEALASNTSREAHRFLGFVRFRDTRAGVLYSSIEPDNYILPQLAEHFSGRMPDERWMIHDTNRGLCVVYDKRRYIICATDRHAYVEESEFEDVYQDLWKTFYRTVAVEARESKKRLNHMLPKKYRKNLTEYTPGKKELGKKEFGGKELGEGAVAELKFEGEEELYRLGARE